LTTQKKKRKKRERKEKGKERKGKERKGKERKGKERKNKKKKKKSLSIDSVSSWLLRRILQQFVHTYATENNQKEIQAAQTWQLNLKLPLSIIWSFR